MKMKIVCAISIVTIFLLSSCADVQQTELISSQTSSEASSQINSQFAADIVKPEDIEAHDILQLKDSDFIIKDENKLYRYSVSDNTIREICELSDSGTMTLVDSDKVLVNDLIVNLTDGTKTPKTDYFDSVPYDCYYEKGDVYFKSGEKFNAEEYNGKKLLTYPDEITAYGKLTADCQPIFTGRYIIAEYNTGETMPAMPDEEAAEYYLVSWNIETGEEKLLNQSEKMMFFDYISEEKIIASEDSKATTVFSCDGVDKETLNNTVYFADLVDGKGYILDDGILYHAKNTESGASVIKYDTNAKTEEVIYETDKEIDKIVQLSDGTILAKCDDKVINTQNGGVVIESADECFAAGDKLIAVADLHLSVVESM